jgi:alpha-1,3-rhamnosyl/mannosyltransferase
MARRLPKNERNHAEYAPLLRSSILSPALSRGNAIGPNKMRVALNASILRAPRTGIGQYVAGLVMALQEQSVGNADNAIELDLLLGRHWSTRLPPADPPGHAAQSARLTALLREVPGAYRLRRLLGQRAFNQGLRRQPADLYHEPSLWPYDFDGPMVMTLHDLTHVRYPETQPPARLREIERHIERGVTQAARILVDSAYIGHEATQHFGLPAGKIIVAPLGCAAEFHPRNALQTQDTLARIDLQHGHYLLCVGTLEPRKNLRLALRAHARLPQTMQKRYPLLVVGMSGWGESQFADELRAAQSKGHVRLAGYLSQEALAAVVAGARALVYPSIYEGFGLPVVEAMKSGTPVIVSDRASLPEIVGEAGIIVAAEDDPSLSHAMQTLIEDETEWQARHLAVLHQAAPFTWARCAEITRQAYRAALTELP